MASEGEIVETQVWEIEHGDLIVAGVAVFVEGAWKLTKIENLGEPIPFEFLATLLSDIPAMLEGGEPLSDRTLN